VQKHTFSRELRDFSREDDFSPSSAQFFQRFFIEKPTCLHEIAQKTDGYRDSCFRKPTQSLHDAYISLHDFGALWRVNKNHVTHLQILYFLQVNKFSREFCSIQAE
jgi:hypothetical protein